RWTCTLEPKTCQIFRIFQSLTSTPEPLPGVPSDELFTKECGCRGCGSYENLSCPKHGESDETSSYSDSAGNHSQPGPGKFDRLRRWIVEHATSAASAIDCQLHREFGNHY